MSLKNFLITFIIVAALWSPVVFSQETSSPAFSWPSWPTGWTWTTPEGWTTPTYPTLPPLTDAIVSAGELGKIQGSYSFLSRPLYGNRDYFYYFTGLPYAKAESYTGENRFKPSKVHEGPLEPTNDEGVYDALNPVIWCPQSKLIDIEGKMNNFTEILGAAHKHRRSQVKGDGYMGQEDCLIATISTPKIQREGEPEMDKSELLPVILFVHGGGFNQFWGSVFGGHRLLNRDVVLVTINYRLGILGSLNYGIDDAPGNALLYDCITALDYIQKYIHHFGGDKDKITISGQSAGAVLSTAVFLSPMAKGKISGAIGQSGSAFSIWATNLTPMDDHVRFATFTSCKNFVENIPEKDIDFQGLTNCIKGLSLGELVGAQELYSNAENFVGRMGYDALVPSIQSPSLKIERCLVESPADVLKNKHQSDVPLMMGVTRHDGSFVFDTTYNAYLVPNHLETNLTFIKNDLLPVFLGGVGFQDKTGALLHSLQHTYVGETAINTDDFESKIPGVLDIHSVIGFKAGGFGLVEEHSKLNPASYYYAFDYKGMFSTYPFASYANTPIPGGISHVDDLIYLFQLFPLFSDEDVEVTKRYVDYWVNFATYGNPNGPTGDEPFPKYSPIDHRFLIINKTDSVGYNCRDTWIDNSLELMTDK